MRGKLIAWWGSERARKRRSEIGDIVLGVLIALALGAVATWIGWRIDVAKAEDSLADELGEIAGQGAFRERTYACQEAKLDQLAGMLDAADRTGRLPPTGPIGEPVNLSWSRGVWDSTVGSDTAGHFGRSMLDNLSGAYGMVDIINARSQAELDAWTRLYAIVGPGRTVSASEIADLRGALAEARVSNRLIVAASLRVHQTIDAFDLPVNRDTIRQYGDTPINRYCTPIAAPDGRPYGQAPLSKVVERVRANPITRDETGLSSR